MNFLTGMKQLYKNKYRRETRRLKGWDYSSNGCYFVTICVKDKERVFGRVENGKMILSEIGAVADKCWVEIPEHFPFVKLYEHAIMPDHVHGVIVIAKNGGTAGVAATQNIASLRYPHNSNRFGPQSQNLASIIRGFKIGVKKWATMNNIGFEWQPRFHDRIIRSRKELSNVRNYIVNNPLNWKEE